MALARRRLFERQGHIQVVCNRVSNKIQRSQNAIIVQRMEEEYENIRKNNPNNILKLNFNTINTTMHNDIWMDRHELSRKLGSWDTNRRNIF